MIEQHLADGRMLTQRVSLAEGASKLVVLRANAGTVPEPGASSRGDASRDSAAARSSVLPYAVGGVGALGVLVGAVSGGMAMRDAAIVRANCEGAACNAEGKHAADRGQTEALISTIAFSVGITGVVAGVVLLATGKKSKASLPSGQLNLRLTSRSVGLAGQF